MPIYLDDQAVQISAENLGAALDAARQKLAASGRIVVEVRLDDQTLSSKQIETQQTQPVDGCDLHLYSADPNQLAVSTLEEVRDRLVQARDMQDQAAEGLQRDDFPAAMKQLGLAIEIWLQTQQAVLQTASLVDINLETLKVEDESAMTIIAGLLEPLRAIKELIGAHDTVALADTLAYEWAPLIDRWDALLVELIQQCQLQQERDLLG